MLATTMVVSRKEVENIMKYTDEHLDEAIKNNIFTEEQVEQFRKYAQYPDKQVTKFQKTLYYIGALLIISAMTWLMADSWGRFGARGISFISAMYFVVFLIAGYFVFFKKKLEIAGGLLLTIPIAVTPLLAFSILEILGVWNQGGQWRILYISTILVALPILIKTKFPFHVFPISVALLFLSMDIVEGIGRTHSLTWEKQALIIRIFGFCMIAVGYLADIKFKKDYSFWLYLFGSMTLLVGLSEFSNRNVFGFILLGAVSVLMILFSLFINRNVILVFGSIGLVQLLSRLSWSFFRHSILFPLALTAIGVLLILAGIFFQRNRTRIDENIIKRLPKFILDLRPKKKV